MGYSKRAEVIVYKEHKRLERRSRRGKNQNLLDVMKTITDIMKDHSVV